MGLETSHVGPFDADQTSVLANLNSHASGGGTAVGAIFFSFGSAIFFYLLLKSNYYIPRGLSAWGIFSFLLYAAVWLFSLILPQYSGQPSMVVRCRCSSPSFPPAYGFDRRD